LRQSPARTRIIITTTAVITIATGSDSTDWNALGHRALVAVIPSKRSPGLRRLVNSRRGADARQVTDLGISTRIEEDSFAAALHERGEAPTLVIDEVLPKAS
jgi:hypothetical protein